MSARLRWIIVALLFAGSLHVKAALDERAQRSAIGREVAVPTHLQDGQEFSIPLEALLTHGKLLFDARWTEQEGGGRPLTKGTGRPLADPSRPLSGTRAFNRISAPDANSCTGCHNAPYSISGGGGDIVTNVFVLGQRFDFMTFDPADTLATRGAVDEAGKPVSLQDVGDFRATTGMFGAGYLEMLARQMTEELQRTRDSIRLGETKELVAKGVHFGTLTLKKDGVWDTSKVEGLGRLSLLSITKSNPPTLVVRPWHQASNVVSLREFSNTAFNQHHGIQSTERFGRDTDPDGDGFTNELTRADVTAVSIWQATLQVPGRVISRDPEVERAVLTGERAFERIGCASCHVPRLPLDKRGWIFSEPNPFNPAGNLRSGETRDLKVDLSSALLPAPRLGPDSTGTVWVEAYTDLKLHNICEAGEPGEAEPLDQNQSQWSTKLMDGNCRFLTKRLWGAANEPPFFHHGLFTTLRKSVLAHSGEAKPSRLAFQALPASERDAVIEFLKTLQVLPPGTKDRIVDDTYRARTWPPAERPERVEIEADKLDAQQLRINATPTVYINGRGYSGHTPLDELKRIVLAEDGRTRAFSDISDTSMSLGPAGAPVTLEIFADLRSPVTGRAIDALKNVMKRHPSEVRIQFRNFPLAFHPQAALAHEAAVMAARSGRFWEFAGYLMDHPSSLTEHDLIALAGRLGLDEASFAQTLHEHRYAARVDADLQSGLKRGIRGSPAILVNGRRIDGVPSLQTLTEYVDAALAARPQTDHPRKP